jgi:hydrogenase maturation factor
MKNFFDKPRRKKYFLLTLGAVLTLVSIPLIVTESEWWYVLIIVGLAISSIGNSME